MRSNPNILTTGEAAKICGVSQQTIIRIIDQGHLKSWRVPGSKFRRVNRADLDAFRAERGIPDQLAEPTPAA